jgi:5-methylcytosine-specific restriction endonuclease McrA
MSRAENDRRYRERNREKISARRKELRRVHKITPPEPRIPVEKIKKNCVICGTPFEVFPCLDRIQCCKKACSVKLRTQKITGPWLPAVRPCLECGKIEEVKMSRCRECRSRKLSERHQRIKIKWTEEQREIRRQCALRTARRIQNDPQRRKRRNLHCAQSNANRRAQRISTKTERISYIKLLTEFGMNCSICGGVIEDGQLSFDHVIPLVRGGTHTMDNIRPAHLSCNKKKSRRLPEEYACLIKA